VIVEENQTHILIALSFDLCGGAGGKAGKHGRPGKGGNMGKGGKGHEWCVELAKTSFEIMGDFI
jgi:hypothetical protein